MEVNELMRPRVICTGTGIMHYPNSPFVVGDILTMGYAQKDGKGVSVYLVGEDYKRAVSEQKVNECPHLFKELEWWQKRELSELPTYLKDKLKGKIVIKIHRWSTAEPDCFVSEANAETGYLGYAKHYEPATEQDYLTYKNTTK